VRGMDANGCVDYYSDHNAPWRMSGPVAELQNQSNFKWPHGASGDALLACCAWDGVGGSGSGSDFAVEMHEGFLFQPFERQVA